MRFTLGAFCVPQGNDDLIERARQIVDFDRQDGGCKLFTVTIHRAASLDGVGNARFHLNLEVGTLFCVYRVFQSSILSLIVFCTDPKAFLEFFEIFMNLNVLG